MDKSKLLQDLFRAYYGARKNKRNSKSAMEFEIDHERKLIELRDEMLNRKYMISPSAAFITFKPVQREIFAGAFRDRVVHHLIFNAINPIFERAFINDSYSCRLGKGTLYGIRRVDHFIRSCSRNYRDDCWILKLDIKGFFMSIDRCILYRQVISRLARERIKISNTILCLIQQTIFNDPVKNCYIKGDRGNWTGLPRSKSLFFARPDRGLPIGNLTSQLFANIYLNDLDHYIKKELKCRYYGRYVDDMVIIHPDKEYLKIIISDIRSYLRQALELDLHGKKIHLQHYRKGVKFLGAFIKPYRIYIDTRTKGNFYRKIESWNMYLYALHGIKYSNATPYIPGFKKKLLNRKLREKLASELNSYMGLMKHFNTYRLRKKTVSRLSVYFWNYVRISEDYGIIINRKIN